MADYTITTDFSVKDALTSGDPEKTILGADIDVEFESIRTAIATKYDTNDLASQSEAQAGTDNTVLMTPLRTEEHQATWAGENAGIVGDLHGLSDPGADRILFWDNSDSAAEFLSVSTGLSLSGNSLTTDDSQIDHDALSNFDANEHIDWTADQGSTNIHTGNITSAAVTQHEGGINHDALTNFVANEHIDWTSNSGNTIDDNNLSSNVPLLNQSNTWTAEQVIDITTTQWQFNHDSDAGEQRDLFQLDKDASRMWDFEHDYNNEDLVINRVNSTGVFQVLAPMTAASLALGGGQTISDSDNVALLDQNNQFTASGFGEDSAPIVVKSSGPIIAQFITGVATDAGYWQHYINTSGGYRLRTLADDDSVGDEAIQFDRTGTSITNVDFPNGTLQYGGDEVGFRSGEEKREDSNYTLVSDDRGRSIRYNGAGGHTYTVDLMDGQRGDIITIVNISGNDLTIEEGTSNLRLGGTTTSGNRTLSGDFGIATLYCYSTSGGDANAWIVTGAGVS